METHMTFYIGTGSETYYLYSVDLVIVFALSLLAECLSHTRLLPDEDGVGVGLIQTGLYAVRMAVAYLVMLAVMSFNAGILIAAVVGFGAGFVVFGKGVLERGEMGYRKPSDLPPLSC